MKSATALLAVGLAFVLSPAVVAQTPSVGAPAPVGATVYFIAPVDGATVTSPFTVKFGLKGMGVAPAGVEFENTGHHHVLVNRDAVTASSAMMKEYMQTELPDLLHFGKGQTEAELKLPPGKHTLQMVLGDSDHHPHNPPVYSERITITVK